MFLEFSWVRNIISRKLNDIYFLLCEVLNSSFIPHISFLSIYKNYPQRNYTNGDATSLICCNFVALVKPVNHKRL